MICDLMTEEWHQRLFLVQCQCGRWHYDHRQLSGIKQAGKVRAEAFARPSGEARE